MERRLLRRAAHLAAAVVVIGGAVVLLRQTDKPTESATPKPVVQTSVQQFADEMVLLPSAGPRPVRPENVSVLPGPHRLQVTWGHPDGTLGFDVQLHSGGQSRRTAFTADRTVQFDGLENGVSYQALVRTVDAFGQRSDPVAATGTPGPAGPDESGYRLVDRFDGPVVPDPARWRLANNAACAQLGRGTGDDHNRLVISAACGTDSAALRSRTPLRLQPGAAELGRVMIETDAPGQDTSLLVDLVPAPVNLVETSPRGTPTAPGALRVRIFAAGVQVNGHAFVPLAVPKPDGLSVRWEVVLRPDGVHVLRNGQEVAAAPEVPTWTEATPLFGFVGSANGVNHVGIDAIGLSTADTPAFVAPPRLAAVGAAGSGVAPDQPVGTERLAGVLGGQLRATIRPNHGIVVAGPFVVEVGGRTFPVRPAVPGQKPVLGLRYPVVADLPADALLLAGDRRELRVRFANEDPGKPWNAAVQHADIELVPDPGSRPDAGQAAPPGELGVRPHPVPADPRAELLDAAGAPLDAATPAGGGRVVLQVTATGPGELAGLAGIEVRVDGRRIAGLPTTADGPGVAGRWRLALNTGPLAPGVRNLEVRAISTDPGAGPQIGYVSLHITR